MGCLRFPIFLSSAHRKHAPPELVNAVFNDVANGKDSLDAADLANFLSKYQGESDVSEAQSADLLAKIVAKSATRRPAFGARPVKQEEKSSLDLQDFVQFLLDPSLNSALRPAEKPTQDMTAPLAHYFIYTSHNSYLTGNQLTSKSSVAPIIDSLRSGCRVIELDCWGRKGKIVVLHGNTLTKPVSFEDCIRAIKENAFVASEYPVIITIENHLPPDLQKEAAKIMKEIIGDALFLPSAQERPPRQFASPEELKGKIIISDTPPRDPVEEQVATDPEAAVDIIPDLVSGHTRPEEDSPPLSPKSLKYRARKELTRQVEIAADAAVKHNPPNGSQEQPRMEELEELIYIFCQKPSQMKEAPLKGELISAEDAIMANMSEPQLQKFIKKNPGSIIEYTKKSLGRMYPFGLRFDSSNADPFLAWTHGFQLAAINTQGRDRPCWIAQAFFYANGGCGYVKKPDVLLFESNIGYEQMDNMPTKCVLKVRILMGTDWNKLFDYFKKPDFYVKLALHGMPSDKCKKKTKVANISSEPNWEDQLFVFPVKVPDIAVLRLEVWEEDKAQRDDFVGQACFPLMEMKTGIRAVPLRSRKGLFLGSKLLCHFELA